MLPSFAFSSKLSAYFATKLIGKLCLANSNPPDKPIITADRTQGQPPLDVNFTCKTTDPDGDNIVKYEWSILKSQSSNPDIKITTTNKLKYQFKTDGLYEVRCSATDSKGNKSIESDSVTVDVFTNGGGSNTPPSISTFRPDIYSGYAPLKVIFNWNVSDKDNDSVSCTLDTDNDGIVDYAINDCISTKSQFHTYQSNGKYTAKLIAIDTKNNKTEKTVNIEVYYKTTTKDGKEVKVLAENATINKANIIDTANIPSLPSNVKALYAISFKSTLKQGEDTVTVKFKLPSNIPSNVKIYKLVNNQYIDITDKVYKNGNTIEFSVKDNSNYDTNSTTGIIEDPVVIAEDIGSTDSESSGSGCNLGSNINLLPFFVIVVFILFNRFIERRKQIIS